MKGLLVADKGTAQRRAPELVSKVSEPRGIRSLSRTGLEARRHRDVAAGERGDTLALEGPRNT
eukprot:12342352-Alexandrium_andersonii.AAC.1